MDDLEDPPPFDDEQSFDSILETPPLHASDLLVSMLESPDGDDDLSLIEDLLVHHAVSYRAPQTQANVDNCFDSSWDGPDWRTELEHSTDSDWIEMSLGV
jgi:hypothetical protein